jgi:TonB family protein
MNKMKKLLLISSLVGCFIGLSLTSRAYDGPIDFKQIIGTHLPIFSKPNIIQKIDAANDNIENQYYNGIVYLDGNNKKYPVARSKNLQLFPLKMLSDEIVYCVNRPRKNSPDQEEYYIIHTNVVSKFDEVSMVPVEFNISNAEWMSLFSNFNPISSSQLNCFFAGLLNQSFGNYTWYDEFQKQDYIQNIINQLSQNKYQTGNQSKENYVTFRGKLAEYDFQTNSFSIDVIYLDNFSPSLTYFPFNVAFELGGSRKEIANRYFGSPNEEVNSWKEFRQLDDIGSFNYKVEASLARSIVKSLNEDREVNVQLVLKSIISGNKEGLNCSSENETSNRIKFQVQSMNVLPITSDVQIESSEVNISTELEALLNNQIITTKLTNSSNSHLSTNSDDELFTAVEHQAEFPGGPRAFGSFLQKNLRYPSAAQGDNVGGKVYVQFVVNTDGTAQDFQILKSVGFGCDEEAIRVLKSVPRWTPGKQSGRPVRSRFTQPITFVLSE